MLKRSTLFSAKAFLILSFLISPLFGSGFGISLGGATNVFAEGVEERVLDGNLELCNYLQEREIENSPTGVSSLSCENVGNDTPLVYEHLITIRANENLVLKNVNLSLEGYHARFDIGGTLKIESSEIKNDSNCLFFIMNEYTSDRLTLKSGTFSTSFEGTSASPICVERQDDDSAEDAFLRIEDFIDEDSLLLDSATETEISEVVPGTFDLKKDQTEKDREVFALSTASVKVVEKGKGEEPEIPTDPEPKDPENPETPEEPKEPESTPTSGEIENPNTKVDDLTCYYVLFTTFSVVFLTTVYRDKFSRNR